MVVGKVCCAGTQQTPAPAPQLGYAGEDKTPLAAAGSSLVFQELTCKVVVSELD